MASAVLMLPFGITMPLHAQTQWQTIDAGTEETTQPTLWEAVHSRPHQDGGVEPQALKRNNWNPNSWCVRPDGDVNLQLKLNQTFC